MTVKLSSCFDIKIKFDRDYLLLANFIIYLPPPPRNTTWHRFYPISPKARTKMAGIVNNVFKRKTRISYYAQ